MIGERLDAVQALVDDPLLREDLRAALRGVPDIDRALSRLALGRGGPRDLACLRDGLAGAARIADMLDGATGALDPADLRGMETLAADWTRRWWPSRRCCCATAAPSPRAMTPNSTTPAACATKGAA